MKVKMTLEKEAKELFPEQFHKVRVVCPHCRTGELTLESVNVHCTHCGTQFLARGRLLDLLPETSQVPLAAPMEWGWMAQLYETRWWRAGPLNTLFLGISFEKEYEKIVKAMNLTGEETLLDVACGPGMYARPLARRMAHGMVVGLDLSIPMLNYANYKIQTEGISNLLLIHGSATDLPFPENYFDVVNCCGALHLFSGLSTVKGICRVLKPGGRFTVATTRRLLQGPVGKRIYDYLTRRGGVTYFYRDELESLLSQSGLAQVRCYYDKRYWHIMSAVKPE
jgi:SAM-dependent methyltransferase